MEGMLMLLLYYYNCCQVITIAFFKSKKNTASQQASTDELTAAPNSDGLTLQQERFAEFAESVEVGLADYFLGP